MFLDTKIGFLVEIAMLNRTNMRVSGTGNNVAGGNLTITPPNRNSSLRELILTIRRDFSNDSAFTEFLEELSEYMKDRPNSEIIGLEEKLKKGNREDLIRDATYLKNKFSKLLVRGQLSISSQKIFCHILAHICTVFRMIVKPQIVAGVTKQQIEQTIYDEIINKIYAEISDTMTDITQDHIHGMIYYLTGNCHLDWA